MGLYRYAPKPSGRMGLLWTLGGIPDTAVLEFGSMGHMLYAERWLYQSAPFNKGKVYATHLDEKDIALGINKRFFQALDEIIAENPKVTIFLLPSTVPSITGVDMEDLCFEAREKYENPIILLKKGSFHEKLHDGIEEGLFRLVNDFAKKEKKEKSKEVTFNIIGSCIDVAKYHADVCEIKRMLKEALGMEAVCVLTSDTTMEQVKNMGSTHINLVIRKEGLKAAQALKDTFGTEYIYGRPYGYEGTVRWLREIADALNLTLNDNFIEKEIEEGQQALSYCHTNAAGFRQETISIGGNYDVVKGIMDFATKEVGLLKKHIWCDVKEYEDAEVPYQSEEDLIKHLNNEYTGILMADSVAFDMTGRNSNLIINRGLNNRLFNPYETPYVGFRGALNLCDLWLDELMGNR